MYVYISEIVALFIFRILSPTKMPLTQVQELWKFDYSNRFLKVVIVKWFSNCLQAFSQSIPLFVTFSCFAFLTPLLSDAFGEELFFSLPQPFSAKFLTTTLLWHLCHGVDGFVTRTWQTQLLMFQTHHWYFPYSTGLVHEKKQQNGANRAIIIYAHVCYSNYSIIF